MRARICLAALAGALAVCVAAAPASAWRGPQRWCNGQKGLCGRHLEDVVLAGAHNAMSSANLGWIIPNQTLTIPQQLDYGIRGLLYDTHYGRLQDNGTVRTDDNGTVTTGQRGLYLCHVYCELGATPLIDVLASIRDFLATHPRNVLAIVNEDYISPSDYAAAVDQSGLGAYVYRGATGPDWPTLRKMIKRHQQVLMLAEHDAGTVPWYHRAYDGILQETPYTFNSPNLLTDPVNWPASCQPNRGGTTGSLFLVNHWSPATPPAHPDPVASAAVNARDVLLGRAAECTRDRGLAPTIIAADQVSYGGLLDAVRELNATHH
ncbi:MAG: hypothetical protein U0R52_03650 [Solirubrobacterales bacterium]